MRGQDAAARDAALERLRALVALCERCPVLPVPAVGEWCVVGGDDAAGEAEIEWLAYELRRAGVAVSVTSERGHTQVHGGPFHAFYVARRVMADHAAHMSYVDNLRSEATSPAVSAVA